MKNKLFLILFISLFLFPTITWAGQDDDCYDTMGGDNKQSIGGSNYISYDTAGVKEACQNKFPSWGERFILQRNGLDAFEATYKVRRSYCWFRDYLFHSGGCLNWGDNYSAVFQTSDVKSANDSSGSKTLRNSIGFWGHHVCLKRFAPGEDFLHGGTNNKGRTAICGYVVYAILSDGECQSPALGWSHALIGCVERPLKPAPPTYNPVIPATITPFLDPKIQLNDYIDSSKNLIRGYISMGSTFDQPLIQLLDGSTQKDVLLLRYKFPNDNRSFDNIPTIGKFSSDNSGLTYEARVTSDNPNQVCACESNQCEQNIFLGCVDRPTPKDSNLKIVAIYTTNIINNIVYPAVYPAFVYVNAIGDIMYYDEDNSQVSIDTKGSAFKMDEKGFPTNTPAKGVLHFNSLPNLSSGIAANEYFPEQLSSTVFLYAKNKISTYGLEFEAIIPNMRQDGFPAYISIETIYSRVDTDRCGAFTIAENQLDSSKPKFYIPSGARERSGCVCPANQNPQTCLIPPVTPCKDGAILGNDPDALRIYCPGVLQEPSQVSHSNMICLQLGSAWNIIDFNYDKMCVQIPSSCEEKPEPLLSYGMSVWPNVPPGNTTTGNCNAGMGVELSKIYQWNPKIAIDKASFDCNKVNGDCNYIYTQRYLPQFALANDILQSMQALANNFHRNLNKDEINKINQSIGEFSNFHTLTNLTAPPTRTCDAKTKIGLIDNSCKFINSCSDITIPSQASGYATWKKIDELTANQLNSIKQDGITNFNISQQGTCGAGYKNGNGGAPSRKCYMKYSIGERVVEQWDEVINPCVKN